MPTTLLPNEWTTIPLRFHERLGDQVGRQRLMIYEGHLLLILHQVPEEDHSKREGTFFWRNPQGVWKSSHLVDNPMGLHCLLNEYTQKIEYFDNLEHQAKRASEYFMIIEGMAPLYRSIGHLHQVLQEARIACPADRELIKIRDRAYDLERTAELFYNGTRNALDFLVAIRTEQQLKDSHSMNIAAHRLNILAAFFFPLSIFSSLFGGSYKDVLEGTFPGWSFLIILCTSLLCGILLTKVLSQKKPFDPDY